MRHINDDFRDFVGSNDSCLANVAWLLWNVGSTCKSYLNECSLFAVSKSNVEINRTLAHIFCSSLLRRNVICACSHNLF